MIIGMIKRIRHKIGCQGKQRPSSSFRSPPRRTPIEPERHHPAGEFGRMPRSRLTEATASNAGLLLVCQ